MKENNSEGRGGVQVLVSLFIHIFCYFLSVFVMYTSSIPDKCLDLPIKTDRVARGCIPAKSISAEPCVKVRFPLLCVVHMPSIINQSFSCVFLYSIIVISGYVTHNFFTSSVICNSQRTFYSQCTLQLSCTPFFLLQGGQAVERNSVQGQPEGSSCSG